MRSAVWTNDVSLIDNAKQLAQQLKLPYCDLQPSLADYDVALVLTPQGLGLQSTAAKSPLIQVDFVNGRAAHRRRYGGGKQQTLARAIGAHKRSSLNVWDGTAGFGRDAWVLACLGCQLSLWESQPWIAALLADGLQRAQQHPDTAEIAKQICFYPQDSSTYWQQHPQNQADVIYLDPMYPPRQKSAAVKKDMALLHLLHAPHQDQASQLLSIARQYAKRVVVKRPRHAEYFEAQTPQQSLFGKHTRYDLYLRA